MGIIKPNCRQQLQIGLSIENYISPDNPVRVIDAFVDMFVHENPSIIPTKGNNSVGRNAYSFATIAKLYLYGYMNSVSSSRKLEKETHRNLEVKWLLADLKPDHKTISDFRRHNESALKELFNALRQFLVGKGLISGKIIATDGTKIKAYTSRNGLCYKEINARLADKNATLERYLEKLKNSDSADELTDTIGSLSGELAVEPALLAKIADLQNKIQELEVRKQLLDDAGTENLPVSDPQARFMKSKDGYIPAYNVQSVVDGENHLIASLTATNDPIDYHSLQDNVEQFEAATGLKPEIVLADAGYANEFQIKELEAQGINCVVPFPKVKPSAAQRSAGIEFSYDSEADVIRCNRGGCLVLVSRNVKKKQKFYDKYQEKSGCFGCSVRDFCTSSSKGRTVYRRVGGEWLSGHSSRMQQADNKALIRKRGSIVEHPFGTIKSWMGFTPLFLRGLRGVQTELNLCATAYNLRRLQTLYDIPTLVSMFSAWRRTQNVGISDFSVKFRYFIEFALTFAK